MVVEHNLSRCVSSSVHHLLAVVSYSDSCRVAIRRSTFRRPECRLMDFRSLTYPRSLRSPTAFECKWASFRHQDMTLVPSRCPMTATADMHVCDRLWHIQFRQNRLSCRPVASPTVGTTSRLSPLPFDCYRILQCNEHVNGQRNEVNVMEQAGRKVTYIRVSSESQNTARHQGSRLHCLLRGESVWCDYGTS